MGRCYWFFPLAIGACLVIAFQAKADDIAACNNANPDVKIFGCSAIIEAGTEAPETIATAHFNRGLAYHAKRELDHAIADYDRAVALNPEFAQAYNGRGKAYFQKGDNDRAMVDLDRAVELDPEYADAYANRGLVEGWQGKKEGAAADFREVLALRPGDPVATEGLQRLGVAPVASKTKRAAKGTFKRFANTDFAGALLEKKPAGSAQECEAKCQAHGDCAAFTYNVWNAACFLKSKVTAALLEPSSVSGLPLSAASPPKSAAAESMARYRGRVFPGKPYSSAAAASFETCEGRCEDDARCLAFSYVKASSSCRQFATAGEYLKDRGIDSGVKRQVWP
jgi:tetratricopeptide (TPR) repeat protein